MGMDGLRCERTDTYRTCVRKGYVLNKVVYMGGQEFLYMGLRPLYG